IVSSDVTRKYRVICTQAAREFLNIFLESLTLIRKGKLRSGLMPSLSNVPSNAALVGHPEDDTHFVLQHRALLSQFAPESIRRHCLRQAGLAVPGRKARGTNGAR